MAVFIMAVLVTSFILYMLIFYKNDSLFVRPNLLSLTFYRDYVFFTMIPYIYFVNNDRYQEHYILNQLSSSNEFIYATISALLFILLFFITYKICYSPFSNYLKLYKVDINEKKLTFYLNCITVFLFLFIIISSKLNNSGIIYYISGSSDLDSSIIRAELSYGGTGFLVINKLIISTWTPIFCYFYYYIYLKRIIFVGIKEKIFLVLMVITGILSAIYFLQKATLFLFLFGFLGIYIYSGRKINFIVLGIFIIIGIFIISIFYLISYGDKILGIEYLFNIITHRIMTQSVGSVMAFDYFSINDMKGMSGVSNIWASAFGDKFSSPYSDIIKYYDPQFADISGAMSSFVTGEAFGLFGWFGVFISGILIGLWYSFFEATKNSRLFSLIFVGIYGIYFSSPVIASSFYSFIWPVGIFYSILPILILILLSRK
jgi:oligosaccharide repeat unit polymerase